VFLTCRGDARPPPSARSKTQGGEEELVPGSLELLAAGGSHAPEELGRIVGVGAV
jgi:hypothetical protein